MQILSLKTKVFSKNIYFCYKQNKGGEWTHYDGHARNPHSIAAQDNVLLSKSPMPEFWCSILYFELDTQVSIQMLD
jgi:hypothetical protein